MKENFHWLLIAGIALGLASGDHFQFPHVLIDVCVGIIIFLGFYARPQLSDLEFSKRAFLKGWCLQKVALPLLVFAMVRFLAEDFAMGAMLLIMLPAAGVSPSLARLCGGRVSLSLRLLVVESVLATIAMPLLFFIASSGESAIDPFSVAKYLAGVLLVPMVISEILRFFTGPDRAHQFANQAGIFSILTITVLVFLIAAAVRSVLIQDIWLSLVLLGVSFILAPFLVWFGVQTSFVKTTEAKISYGIKNMYINIGLGLGVAASQLGDMSSLLILVYMIPINSLPKFAAWFARRLSTH